MSDQCNHEYVSKYIMLSIGATKKGPGGALPPNKKQNGVYKEQNMTKKEQNGAFFGFGISEKYLVSPSLDHKEQNLLGPNYFKAQMCL